MRIGILTGGGDVPGLNSCIKALVCHALDQGHQVVGIKKGWAGLLGISAADTTTFEQCTIELTAADVKTAELSGENILHTSRTDPARTKRHEIPQFLLKPAHEDLSEGDTIDFTEHTVKSVASLGLDAIVPIGGDDTLNFALRLHHEGVPVVAIPKTMDNDVYGTDFSIGFSTAITRSVEFINRIRAIANSNERIAIIEMFGRNSGETSLIAGYLAGVDRSVISEVPFNLEKLAKLLNEDRKHNQAHSAIVTISEGSQMLTSSIMDELTDSGTVGQKIQLVLGRLTGQETIYQQIAYLMRSGEPDALDRMVALNFGKLAVQLAINKEFGKMLALREGKYTYVSLETLKKGQKRVDVEQLYDAAHYRPNVAQMLGKPMFLY